MGPEIISHRFNSFPLNQGRGVSHSKKLKTHKPHSGTEIPQGDQDKISIGENTSPVIQKPVVAKTSKKRLDENMPHATAPPQKKWTILFYWGADNDLEPSMVEDIIEMEKMGSTGGMNLLVQLDRGKTPSDLSDGWAGTRRYKIEKGDDHQRITSPIIQDLGQINMADPKHLEDFLTWGMTNYPAQNYMVVIGDHGGGWEGAIEDKSHKGWMTMPEMRQALENTRKNTGKDIDIIGFDACLMSQVEVAYELKDVAKYMVASEESEGKKGWEYNRLLTDNLMKNFQSSLLMKLNLTPKEVTNRIVQGSALDPDTLPTMSSIDLSKMEALGQAVDKFAKAIIDTDTSKSTLKATVKKSQPFSGFKDLYDFAERITLNKDIKDEKLKNTAQEVMKSVKEAVMEERHSEEYKGAHGLSINLPSFNMDLTDKYRQLKFAQNTYWDEAVEHIGAKKNPPGTTPTATA